MKDKVTEWYCKYFAAKKDELNTFDKAQIIFLTDFATDVQDDKLIAYKDKIRAEMVKLIIAENKIILHSADRDFSNRESEQLDTLHIEINILNEILKL